MTQTLTARACVRCGVAVHAAPVGAVTCDRCWRLAMNTQWFKGQAGQIAPRLLGVLVLVWLLFGASLVFGQGRELHVFQISTPDDAVCDGQDRYAFWANTLSFPIYVIGWRVTPLVSQKALADVRWGLTHYWGSDATDQKGIDSGSWDHYAEPTQDQSVSVWSSPHYRTIWPGQGIAIYTRCAPMANSPAAQSGLVVLIRFTVEQP